jgi:hypothetical protein
VGRLARAVRMRQDAKRAADLNCITNGGQINRGLNRMPAPSKLHGSVGLPKIRKHHQSNHSTAYRRLYCGCSLCASATFARDKKSPVPQNECFTRDERCGDKLGVKSSDEGGSTQERKKEVKKLPQAFHRSRSNLP